jgi:hypothetical protein
MYRGEAEKMSRQDRQYALWHMIKMNNIGQIFVEEKLLASLASSLSDCDER